MLPVAGGEGEQVAEAAVVGSTGDDRAEARVKSAKSQPAV